VLVKILSFGCNWWSRFGNGPDDRFRYTKHAAYYNSTGVRCGRKIRRHWIVPGLIRFNGTGDFDPYCPHRSVGQVFSCTEPIFAYGGNRVLFERKVKRSEIPDYFLVGMSSERYGRIDFNADWRPERCLAIATSDLREKQEALLLMKLHDWVRSNLGLWRLILTKDLDAGAVLQLDEEEGC
jgi:hypothetical protein